VHDPEIGAVGEKHPHGHTRLPSLAHVHTIFAVPALSRGSREKEATKRRHSRCLPEPRGEGGPLPAPTAPRGGRHPGPPARRGHRHVCVSRPTAEFLHNSRSPAGPSQPESPAQPLAALPGSDTLRAARPLSPWRAHRRFAPRAARPLLRPGPERHAL
jgi:hypothetical protein